MPHLELTPKRDTSAFRKIAIGTWKNAYDPSVYGTIEVTMDRAMDYIDRYRRATGRRLTVTHLVAKAIAHVLHQEPDANALLRFNRIYLRRRVSVFVQVAMADPATGKVDLSGTVVSDLPHKDLATLIDELEQRVRAVRSGTDEHLERSRTGFARLPGLLVGPVLRLVSLLMFTFNLDLTRWGLPRDPFGSVMVTNIGSLGLEMAYVPLVPMSRVPILLAVGEVRAKPMVEEGRVVIRRRMKINATFDHRFIDGYHAAVMSRMLRAWLEEPERHFGPVPGPGAGGSES